MNTQETGVITVMIMLGASYTESHSHDLWGLVLRKNEIWKYKWPDVGGKGQGGYIQSSNHYSALAASLSPLSLLLVPTQILDLTTELNII